MADRNNAGLLCIYVYDTVSGREGYLKAIKEHKGKKYVNSGLQRVEPVFACSKDEIKTWKDERTAVKYANRLADKFGITVDDISSIRGIRVLMKYVIDVRVLQTGVVVHRIKSRNYTI